MTTDVRPLIVPPISAVFIPQGEDQWVNPVSGDVVRWDSATEVYQRWNPATAAWSWWGPSKDQTMTWHLYQAPKTQSVDFWVLLVVGIVAFGICASQGFVGLGVIALVWFTAFGLAWSWLHTRHPDAYAVTTAASLGYGAWSAISHHHPGSQ